MRVQNLVLIAPLVVAFVLSGCGPKPYDREHPAGQVSSSSPAPVTGTALLGPARLHPAPVGTPTNLDQAESGAAAHPGDIGAQRSLAFCYYKLRAFAQAIPAFRKVLALAPDDTAASAYVGYSQMAMGDLTGGKATFLKLTERSGLSPAVVSDAYLQIGNCAWASNDLDGAAEAFSRSIGADSRQGMASLGLGTFAAGKGRVGQAHDFFADAARDLPPGVDRAQTFACLGRLAEQTKNHADALADYGHAVALDPRNAWALRGLSRLKAPVPGPARTSSPVKPLLTTKPGPVVKPASAAQPAPATNPSSTTKPATPAKPASAAAPPG